VEVYPEPDKLGRQFKYAAAAGVRHVAIIGGDERARGVVTVKDMTSGEQLAVPRAGVGQWFSAGAAHAEPAPSGPEDQE
jgi:histidyl-tRNA synthetase